MNRFARSIVITFVGDSNSHFLLNQLQVRFKGYNEVKCFLKENFKRMQSDFSRYIERNFLNTDPVEGSTVQDHVMIYNNEFLRYLISEIEQFVLSDSLPNYSVREVPECRQPAKQCKGYQTTDAKLADWTNNPASLMQYRDDPQTGKGGSCYNNIFDDKNYCKRVAMSPIYCGNATTKWRSMYPSDEYAHNVEYQTEDDRIQRDVRQEGFRSGQAHTGGGAPTFETDKVGFNFCDQSDVNTSLAYEMQFNTLYIQELNKDPYPHTATAFGESTPASDSRLLSRRTFRSNEDGEENGIPRYERRLQRRNLDRNVDETLHDTQYDYQQRKHDMCDLVTRTNNKKKLYDTNKNKLNITDQMRYDALF